MNRFFVEASYEAAEGCRFDFELYQRSHIPLAEKQMARGNVRFLKRILRRNIDDFFTSVPLVVLSLTYVLEHESDVVAFREFMKTDLVQPLIEDAAACSNCKIRWATGTLSEF